MTDDKQSEPPQSRQQQLRDASRPSTAAQQDGDEGKADEQEEDGEEGSPREHGREDCIRWGRRFGDGEVRWTSMNS